MTIWTCKMSPNYVWMFTLLLDKFRFCLHLLSFLNLNSHPDSCQRSCLSNSFSSSHNMQIRASWWVNASIKASVHNQLTRVIYRCLLPLKAAVSPDPQSHTFIVAFACPARCLSSLTAAFDITPHDWPFSLKSSLRQKCKRGEPCHICSVCTRLFACVAGIIVHENRWKLWLTFFFAV